MAHTARISRLVGIPRNQGVQVPGAIPLSEWVDSVVLAATVAQSYAVKTDSFGNKAFMLRLSSNVGPIYVNPYATAVVPTGTTTDGSSAICLMCHLHPVVIALPAACAALSLISPSNSVVTIEAWN